jgi:ornithine cyclodeaminase
MLILNASEVRQSLPMAECIEAMKRAYMALTAGKAEVPLRMRLPVKPNSGLTIFMPAFVDDTEGQALAVKIVSLFDKNPERGLPFIHAGVLVLNPETGAVEALLEGGSLTAIRTGAGCGAATDVLAHNDAHTAAIFGAGVQARTQLAAVCEVRHIQQAWIYDTNPDQVKMFISEMSGQGRIPKSLRPAHNSTEAILDADIISTATTSKTPVFIDSDLKAGVHINGIGSYTLEMQEIPSETVSRARVTVDSRSAAQVESGDIAIPLQKKLIKETEIAEIGDVFSGKQTGRSKPEQITVFKSVGVAVQDAVAARLAVENARKLGVGTDVAW